MKYHENIMPKLPERWEWTRVHEISTRIKDGTRKVANALKNTRKIKSNKDNMIL